MDQVFFSDLFQKLRLLCFLRFKLLTGGFRILSAVVISAVSGFDNLLAGPASRVALLRLIIGVDIVVAVGNLNVSFGQECLSAVLAGR